MRKLTFFPNPDTKSEDSFIIILYLVLQLQEKDVWSHLVMFGKKLTERPGKGFRGIPSLVTVGG